MFTSQHGLKSLLQIYISPMLREGEFMVGLVGGNGNCGWWAGGKSTFVRGKRLAIVPGF